MVATDNGGWGGGENAYKHLGRKTVKGRGLGDLGVNSSAVLVDGKEMGREGADWSHCFQEWFCLRALWNGDEPLGFTKYGGSSVTSCVNVIPQEGFCCMALGSCGQVKFTLETDHEGSERKWRYSCTFSLTSTVDGVGGQRHALAALTLGKQTRYTLCGRHGGPQGQSGQLRKIFHLRNSIRTPYSP